MVVHGGLWTVRGGPWTVYVQSIHGGYMGCSIDSRWTVHGGSMDSAWWSMVGPWWANGSYMMAAWRVHRGPRWVHGQPMNSP